MTIVRYVNGKEISEEDLYKLHITNPTIQYICKSVALRYKKMIDDLSRQEKFISENS